jgi:hypothetical protein
MLVREGSPFALSLSKGVRRPHRQGMGSSGGAWIYRQRPPAGGRKSGRSPRTVDEYGNVRRGGLLAIVDRKLESTGLYWRCAARSDICKVRPRHHRVGGGLL